MSHAVAKCGRQSSEMTPGLPLPGVCTSYRIQGAGNLGDFVPAIWLLTRFGSVGLKTGGYPDGSDLTLRIL